MNEYSKEQIPDGAITIDGNKTYARTVSLSLRALSMAQFRMRLHNQTLDEVIEEVLLAMQDPQKAQEMAMEYLTNPVGVGPDTK